MVRIGIVAGEASGDVLGAELIRSLRTMVPDAVIAGIGGPHMQRAGCKSLFSMEKLSVMGLMEVIGRYRELTGIRNAVASYFIQNPPDVFMESTLLILIWIWKLYCMGIKSGQYTT